MALWGGSDYQNNAPKSTTFTSDRVAKKRLTGVGNVATTTSVADVNNITSFNNTTVGAFQSLVTRGTFGVSVNEAQIKAGKGGVSPGWVNVSYGTGPVTYFTVNSATTSGFANGETVKISGATTNGSATVTTNATGNVVSLAVTYGGAGFTNAAAVSLAFNREKHLGSIAVTPNATAIGYSNTDVITASNGTINAVATLTTNATGGITTTTVTNVGLFGNTQANSTVVFTVANATGGATTGNTASTVFAANLVTSSNTGAVLSSITVGGRANRVQYENLAVVRGFNAGVDSENTVFLGL
jgi:hypothetical protein